LRTAFLLLVALGAGCGAPSATQRTTSQDVLPTPVVAALHDFQGVLRTVDVVVAGKPRRFLLDTGAGVTVLSPLLAAEAGCQPAGRITGFRMGGDRLDLPRCLGVTILLGTAQLRVAEAAMFAVGALFPPGWPAVDGVLSLQTLLPHALTLDVGGGTLTLETISSLHARVAVMTPVLMRPGRQAGGAALDVFLAASTARGPLWLEVDTGNLAPLLLAPHAAEVLGLDLAHPRVRHAAATSEDPETWDIPEVTLQLGNIPVTAPAQVRELIVDGNIGLPVLARVVLTLDLVAGRAWMKARARP